jgi:hypothetical protein
MITLDQFDRADILAKAAMLIRPDLPQNLSLDDWLASHGDQLTERERNVAMAALAYHPDHNPDF